jgi:predicted acetyltransferase
MTISLRDARANKIDQQWIGSVYSQYLGDLGLLNTGIFPALGEIGHREPDQLQRWLVDPTAILLTILDDLQPVGFAMVARDSRPARSADFRMAEFFVIRAARGRGVGRSAVRLIFDRFAGRWEITEYSRNPGAVKFWRKVVAGYTGGAFRERTNHGEVCHYFTSAPSRPAA